MMAGESYGRVALKEARRMWPFVLGFGVTLAIVLKTSLSVTRITFFLPALTFASSFAEYTVSSRAYSIFSQI